MKISASRLKMYLTCPRQFKYAYVDELPKVLTGALAFGLTVHRTLHELHLQSAAMESELDVDYALDMFDYLWRESLKRDQPTFKTADEVEAYWTLADDILRRYVTTYKDAPAPLVLEFPFEMAWFDPSGEEYQLCGVIDRLDESAQGLVVVDFKSGKRKPKADGIGSDLQLLLYAFAVEQVLGQPVQQVALLHLRDGTVLQAAPSSEAMNRLLDEVLPNVVQDIQQQRFAPRYGYRCRYCDFKAVCEAQGPDEPAFTPEEAKFADELWKEANQPILAGQG
jgi:CRISPR/Cas system-associated exonuclease Cas4 (RecB family)